MKRGTFASFVGDTKTTVLVAEKMSVVSKTLRLTSLSIVAKTSLAEAVRTSFGLDFGESVSELQDSAAHRLSLELKSFVLLNRFQK